MFFLFFLFFCFFLVFFSVSFPFSFSLAWETCVGSRNDFPCWRILCPNIFRDDETFAHEGRSLSLVMYNICVVIWCCIKDLTLLDVLLSGIFRVLLYRDVDREWYKSDTVIVACRAAYASFARYPSASDLSFLKIKKLNPCSLACWCKRCLEMHPCASKWTIARANLIVDTK